MENKIIYRNCHESKLAQKYLDEESKDIEKMVPNAIGIVATIHGEPDGDVHVNLQLDAPGRFRCAVKAAEPHMGQAMSEGLKKLKRKVKNTRDKLQQPLRKREPWEERSVFIQDTTDDDALEADYLIKANQAFYHHDDAKRIVSGSDNETIASEMRELAVRLQCLGINKSWVKSFRSASRQLRKVKEPVTALAQDKKSLRAVLKAGSKITGYVKEHTTTGRIKLLQQLRKRTPRDILGLLEVDGIGPKVAMKLYKKHGVESVEDLRIKLDKGELDSIGVKLQSKLKDNLPRQAA